MKKFILPLFVSIVLLNNTGFATVFTVNNVANGPGQFTDVNAAINVASAGDTIYVSAGSFGTITITKPLTICGVGNAADIQFPTNTSFYNIIIGDSISGVNIQGLFLAYLTFGKSNHQIAITRCVCGVYFEMNTIGNNVIGNNLTNSAITDCIFTSSGKNFRLCAGGTSNLLIQNNIFSGNIELSGNNILKNNIFLLPGSCFGFGASCGVNGAIIENNIFYGCNPLSNSGSCSFNNNLCYNSGVTLGGTNLDSIDPLFVNYTGGAFNYNQNFHLQSTSPARNAGIDGKDIGIYGGNAPMSTTGEPVGIPVIRKMDVLNFNAGQGTGVQVKVRSTKAR